jgi:hypothetical protein
MGVRGPVNLGEFTGGWRAASTVLREIKPERLSGGYVRQDSTVWPRGGRN